MLVVLRINGQLILDDVVDVLDDCLQLRLCFFYIFLLANDRYSFVILIVDT